MWFNFNQWGSEEMYIYYPLILLGLSTLILFFPAKILYYRSRKWLIYSMVNFLALPVSSFVVDLNPVALDTCRSISCGV
jgi:hypothetical protein